MISAIAKQFPSHIGRGFYFAPVLTGNRVAPSFFGRSKWVKYGINSVYFYIFLYFCKVIPIFFVFLHQSNKS